VSGVPAGDTELGPVPRDLARITIERRHHDDR
jgi:hypothetical protein